MNIDRPSDRLINLPGMGSRKRDPNAPRKELRLPLIGFLPNKIRNHFIAMAGEFVGTFMFLFFAFSATQVANAANAGAQTEDGSLSQSPNANTLLYISLAFGFSLAVNAWVFFRISGGLFNPAVSFGLALIGAVGWVRAGLVIIAQMMGAMASSAVVSALFPGPLNVSTTLGGNASVAQGLFIEMFLTSMLVFTIFMLAAEKHKGTFLAPVGIGLSLFVAELSGVYFTGGSLNPARSFGPCVVLHDFPGYHWIYWLGPALGALLATGFYRFVKVLEYETANPGQDFNEKEAEVFHFDEDNAVSGADVARPNVSISHPDYVADQLGVRPSRESGQIPGVGVPGAGGNGPATGPHPSYGAGTNGPSTGAHSAYGAGGKGPTGAVPAHDGADASSGDGFSSTDVLGGNAARPPTGTKLGKRSGSFDRPSSEMAFRNASAAESGRA